MPRGASGKREREYDELKQKFSRSGRYKGREEEVAARIVNKQRRQQGETKGQQKQQRKGNNPDRNLPISEYHHKTVDQIAGELGNLSKRQVEKVRGYEAEHKNRKSLMSQLDRRLK